MNINKVKLFMQSSNLQYMYDPFSQSSYLELKLFLHARTCMIFSYKVRMRCFGFVQVDFSNDISPTNYSIFCLLKILIDK